MKKDLNYYLELPWEIKLKKIPKEDGGGWVASIPLLGEKRCLGDGETAEEALKNLKRVLKKMIQENLSAGNEIPEPKIEKEVKEDYSGRILLRIPRSLHFILAHQARMNRMSLNSYLVHLLSLNAPRDQIQKELARFEAKIISLFSARKEENYAELKKIFGYLEELKRESGKEFKNSFGQPIGAVLCQPRKVTM